MGGGGGGRCRGGRAGGGNQLRLNSNGHNYWHIDEILIRKRAHIFWQPHKIYLLRILGASAHNYNNIIASY